MTDYKHAARSANAILGLPDLPGLSSLPADQNSKVSFIEQRIELTKLLQGTLEAMQQKRELKKMMEDGGEDRGGIAIASDPPAHSLLAWPDVEKYLDKVAADVPTAEKAEFDKQRDFVRYASEHGKLPDDVGKLNLDQPERQLLWSAMLIHAYGNEKIPHEEWTRHPLVKAVTHSGFVDHMYNQLAYRLPSECKMVLGAPGSWFYFQPDTKQPMVNLDLCYALICGGGLYAQQGSYLGHFEPIAHHEIGHAKFSRFYPESMQKLWKRMAELATKGGMKLPESFMPDGWKTPQYPLTSELTIDEYKEFNALRTEFTLRQRFWNACEDNCVNRYSVNLGDPEHIKDPAQRHMGNLADSQNVFRTIIETQEAVRHYHDKCITKQRTDSPASRLANLENAVNMAFYLRNRLAPDTPEGRASIGIQDDLLPTNSWNDIKAITKRIEELQPHALDGPGRRYHVKDIHTDEIHNLTFDGKAILFNRWRNEEIEKLLALADPYIQKIMDENKKEIDQKVEKLKQKDDQGRGQSGGEGNGQGLRVQGLSGEQEADMPTGTPQGQKGKADDEPDKAEGETAGSRRKREENGLSPDNDPKKPVVQPNSYQHKPRNAMPSGGNPGQGASNQPSALDKVVLGDGRSYRELKQDRAYKEAVKEAASQLKEMSERVQLHITEQRPQVFDLPIGGNILQRLNREQVRKLTNKLNKGEARIEDFRIVEQVKITTTPVTHDIVLVIDGSGSMGAGMGSRMEIAMKTAALMYDGIRELQKREPEHTRYRLFISLWGDGEDWSKDKEATKKYLIAEPGMKDGEVEARIERILHGIDSGTQLAPAFPNMLKRMQRHTLEGGQHGMMHFIIPSDGMVYDTAATKDRMERLLAGMPNATIDALITENASNNALKEVINQLKTKVSNRDRVNVVDTDWQHAPSQVVDMLRTRQRAGAETLYPMTEEEFQSQLSANARRVGRDMQ